MKYSVIFFDVRKWDDNDNDGRGGERFFNTIYYFFFTNEIFLLFLASTMPT